MLKKLISLVLVLSAVAALGAVAWIAMQSDEAENKVVSETVLEPVPVDIHSQPLPPVEEPEPEVDDEPEAAEADEPEESAVAEAESPGPQVSKNAKAHICYLSFNNPYEASVARTFVNSLAQYADAPRITVTEYQSEDSDPEESLERLVRSGTRCDGLVLSGHHDEDGEFWGDRTDGDLEIDFLNELSARPSLSSWFSNVKALWLQGCHTATTRIFNPDVDSDEKINGSPLTMINRHLNLSELEESLDDLNDIFIENTEEDNIILDYGRVFPSATIYTWWDKSPGIEAGSHWSFPYHVVQTSYVIDQDPKYFKHPFKRPIPQDAALRYAEILYEGLTRPAFPGKHGGPLHADEDTLIKGWKEHGRWAVHKREYSFENASAIGHRSLLANSSGILKQIRGFTILLEQIDEEWVAESPAAVVNTILEHEAYIPYNVYLLWSFAQKSPALKAKIAASHALHEHLNAVIDAPTEDSLEKRDYRRLRSFLFG